MASHYVPHFLLIFLCIFIFFNFNLVRAQTSNTNTNTNTEAIIAVSNSSQIVAQMAALANQQSGLQNLFISKLRSELRGLEIARQNFEIAKTPIENLAFENNVKLNIGGKIFRTSINNFKNFPNSVLGVLFSGAYRAKMNSQREYFIDRDPTYFQFILNFLRNNGVVDDAPDLFTQLRVKEELRFYGLSTHSNLFFDSLILNTTIYDSAIAQWLDNDNFLNNNKKFELIYRQSRDGANYANYIERVKDQGSIIILIKSRDEKYIFGGFMDGGIVATQSTILATKTWLFTLLNEQRFPPTKFVHRPNYNGDNTAFSTANPTIFNFGDLVLNQGANSPITCSFPSYHTDPSLNSNRCNIFGGNSINVAELEVYKLKAVLPQQIV